MNTDASNTAIGGRGGVIPNTPRERTCNTGIRKQNLESIRNQIHDHGNRGIGTSILLPKVQTIFDWPQGNNTY